MTGMNENKNEVMVCPGCRRHCSLDALSCDRGERYKERIEAGEAEERLDYEDAGRSRSRRGHGRETEYDGRDERGRRNERCERGHRGDRDEKCQRSHGGAGYEKEGRHGHRGDWERHHEDGQEEYQGRYLGEHWQEIEDDSLLGLLHSCHHHLFRHAGQSRTQDKVLKLLAQRGELTQKELRQVLDTRPGSISELISKLEAKGLVISEKDPQDRRQSVLKLTGRGMERGTALSQTEGEGQMFDALTEEEQGTLKSLLEKLVNSWK